MDWGGGGGLTFNDAYTMGPILVPYFLLAVAWLAECLVTYWLAGRKHRDGGLWFVLAFFSGPIALIAICLLKTAPKKD